MYKSLKIVIYAILGIVWYKLETERVRKADMQAKEVVVEVDGKRYVGFVERDGSDRA